MTTPAAHGRRQRHARLVLRRRAYAERRAAIAHGRDLLADGADILDIGGESTRPGATRPLVEEELDRVVPVITALAADGATVSVDTMRAEVAEAALAAGATIVNDVSGGLADPRDPARRGRARGDVRRDALARARRPHARLRRVRRAGRGGRRGARRAGRTRRRDAGGRRRAGPDRARPGPRVRQARRAQLAAARATSARCRRWGSRCWSAPAASRSSVRSSPARRHARARSDEREHANTALTVLLAQQGVWGLRVHDVRAASDALRVLERLDQEEADP